jgi:hypothetical protein
VFHKGCGQDTGKSGAIRMVKPNLRIAGGDAPCAV